MEMVELNRGSSPVILGFPHTGTHVPDDIRAKLNETGRKLTDTDWHIHELYRGLLPDATTVRATFHRYCLDANRDPVGASLYPGQNTTGLIPLTDFDNQPLWIEGKEPDETETVERVLRFHRAVPCGAGRRDRAGEGQARRRCSLRLPLDPLGLPVPVRGQAAGFQHRHRQRQDLRSADGTRGWRDLRGGRRLYVCCQRALPRRLDDQALRPARKTASMPSRWS